MDSVLDDVEQEKMTQGHARAEYGVVIDPDTLALDPRATADLRNRMRQARNEKQG